jgi:transposase
MRAGLFWLDNTQWAGISPHLPTNLPGPEREDDRRIISGIIHMLQSGARWRDCPGEYGPYTTIYNRFNRWAKKGRWRGIFEALAKPGKDAVALSLDSTSVKAHRCASGGKGGNTSDRPLAGRPHHQNPRPDHKYCLPIAFLLIGGQVADCVAADTLLDQVSATELLHGDKGYDTDAVRRKIEAKGAAPDIPPKTNRPWKNCFSPHLYRGRNAIERMLGRQNRNPI